MEFTLNEIIEATGAQVISNEAKENEKFSFSTDTRTIKKGQIYLPLKGANFNGEDFIDKALEAGAAGYFCTINAPSRQLSSNGGEGAMLILKVNDALTAYLQLARFCRRKIEPKTIAITGSSGKTTTKEMAFSVASEKFKTHKSELNYNNEIGLCKTILSMPDDTEVLILEMGMRAAGEIEILSKYSEPDIAIIANVGTAHIGRLGSRENIARAKCEIVEYMKSDGFLIAHDDELIKMQRCKDTRMQSLFFSLNNATIIDRQIGYSEFKYKNYIYELGVEGDYNIENSLAVIEMGIALHMSQEEIAKGLKKYSPIEKRWEIKEIKGYKIVNDSYNANPESMRGVIKTVLDIYSPPVLFVLGDMGELGENAAYYHQQIGIFLVDNLKEGVNVFTVGGLANEITKELVSAGFNSLNFENNLQISRYILANVSVGTTIILKASRSMKFEEIIEKMSEK